MENRVLYLFIFVVSLISAVLIKFLRAGYFGINPVVDVLLGSALNFLYVVIFVTGYVTFANEVTSKKLSRFAIGITIGVLLWEVEQGFIDSQVFDWNDVIASLLGLTAMLALIQCMPVEQPSPTNKAGQETS